MNLSLCMPYFRNPRMLHRHLLVWRNEWSDEQKSQVDVVLVDDGSPDETAADALADMWGGDRTGLPSINLYRVLVNRKWGQHAARNIAGHEARSKWLLMTDMDHIVCADTLAEVLRLLPTLGKREVLSFGRVDAPQTLTWRAGDWTEFARTRREDGTLKSHVNSFCVSREHYWKLQGYDETFVGIYGCDQEFRSRLWKASKERHLHDFPLIRVDRSVIADASTRDVERKTPGRNKLKQAAVLQKAIEGRAGKTMVLTSPYERVL